MNDVILEQSQKIDKIHTKMLEMNDDFERNNLQILFRHEQDKLNKMLEVSK